MSSVANIVPQPSVLSNHLREYVNKRTVIAVAAGVGIGFTFAYLMKRWLHETEEPEPSTLTMDSICDGALASLRQESKKAQELKRAPSTRGRCASTLSERPNRQNLRSSTRSITFSAMEADLSNGLDMCIEMKRTVERAHQNLEMVKNRSEKDKIRYEKTANIMEKLKEVEEIFSALLPTLDEVRDESYEYRTATESIPAPARSRTFSVLSDDESFMSAVEAFTLSMDVEDLDYNNEAATLGQNELVFLKQGFNQAMDEKVKYRKSRADFCQCESETEFAAKLYCIRLALAKALEDEHKRLWLAKCGRTLLADFIRNTKQDPIKFFNAYDEMMEFLSNEANRAVLEDEVTSRGVTETGFYDLVIDFIILDSFDDLRSPPSAVYSVTKNYFLSNSMKYSTLNTIIWSILKSKRQRLKNPDGFLAKFYNISETVMPAITLGFLGTDQGLGDLCQYFKEQIIQFVLDIFNSQRVRYRSLEELSEDIWIVLRNRIEAVQTRMSNELPPA